MPPLIREVFELLAREQEDALVQLAAIRTLRGWLGGRERLSLAAARAQEYSWAQVRAAQGRPRQAPQRQASRQAQRPPLVALTAPDFVGVSTAELDFWRRCWSGGGWTPAGPEEASRDPEREQERIRAALRARERRAGAGGGRSRRS